MPQLAFKHSHFYQGGVCIQKTAHLGYTHIEVHPLSQNSRKFGDLVIPHKDGHQGIDLSAGGVIVNALRAAGFHIKAFSLGGLVGEAHGSEFMVSVDSFAFLVLRTPQIKVTLQEWRSGRVLQATIHNKTTHGLVQSVSDDGGVVYVQTGDKPRHTVEGVVEDFYELVEQAHAKGGLSNWREFVDLRPAWCGFDYSQEKGVEMLSFPALANKEGADVLRFALVAKRNEGALYLGYKMKDLFIGVVEYKRRSEPDNLGHEYDFSAFSDGPFVEGDFDLDQEGYNWLDLEPVKGLHPIRPIGEGHKDAVDTIRKMVGYSFDTDDRVHPTVGAHNEMP
jgi:hypothetical protein